MLVDRGDAGGQGRCCWTVKKLVDRWDAGRQGRCWQTAGVLADRSGSPATIPPRQEGES